MTIIGYIILGLAILITVVWCLKIRAKVKNSIIILGAKIDNYERLRIFLNSKDNNYSLNLSPLRYKDFVSDELSNLILLQAGEIILDAHGTFKSGLDPIISRIFNDTNSIIKGVDGIFPLDE